MGATSSALLAYYKGGDSLMQLPPRGGLKPQAVWLLVVFLSSPRLASAWGQQGHKIVNAAAVENLPEPLRSYFRSRKAFLVDHAVDPDRLAKENAAELRHHYTEVESYDSYPFETFRRQFVGERRPPNPLQISHGDSLWQIERFTFLLADAMRRRRWDQADLAAVFAAHYACDLTQPLHTIVNYDGQLTNQTGLHSRFETGLVRALSAQWILKPQPPVQDADLRARIFVEYLESYRHSQLIFAGDRLAVFGRNYHDPEFFRAFDNILGLLARKRLEAAVSFVSSLWYTAWIRAERPQLGGRPLETGSNSYFTDESGVIRWTSEDRPATAKDPPFGG